MGFEEGRGPGNVNDEGIVFYDVGVWRCVGRGRLGSVGPSLQRMTGGDGRER